MRSSSRWLLLLALMGSVWCDSASAQSGLHMPDLWPFNDNPSRAAQTEESRFPSLTWPKVETPQLFPGLHLDPPNLSPTKTIFEPLRRINSATRRFFDGAAGWSLLPTGNSDPAPGLYEDPVGDFMSQPRLDP